MINSLIHSYFKFVLSLHEVLGITNVIETQVVVPYSLRLI